MISARRAQIAASLQDKEYRDIVVSEEIDTGLPFQIRAMRQDRGWSQQDLAERLGMTQEGVSRLESLSYGKFTISTLKRLASAFDVALAVRFISFSVLVDWTARFSSEDLAVPDYEHDMGLADPAGVHFSPLTGYSSGLIPPVHEALLERRYFSTTTSTLPPKPSRKASTARCLDFHTSNAESTPIRRSA